MTQALLQILFSCLSYFIWKANLEWEHRIWLKEYVSWVRWISVVVVVEVVEIVGGEVVAIFVGFDVAEDGIVVEGLSP